MIVAEQKKVMIITHPISLSGITPVSNLIEILLNLSQKIILTSGNEGYYYFINDDRLITYGIKKYTIQKNQIKRIFQYIKLQVKYSRILLNNSDYFNTLLVFFGGGTLFLPILIAKMLHKKVIIILPGSLLDDSNCDPLAITITKIAQFNYLIADRIIIYSPNLLQEWRLEPYREKILIAHEHFIDFNIFTLINILPNRPLLIGYIGRLSAEKGVQHFVQALPIIFSNNQNLRTLIVGEGQLKELIMTSLQECEAVDRVDLTGWISHDNLPNYLNQLRLLVLPSYTEGLPNIMLEAMACGTPVLATPVGAIPDVIRDGETGFIMEDNSPECIARNVMRALHDRDLEGVAERGRRYVEGEFTFEKAVERWRGILRDIE